MGFAKLLLKMIGSLVLAVQPGPGVLTTSSPRLGTVSGTVVIVMEVVVLLLKMTGCVVQDVLPKPGVPTTSNLDLVTVHGVVEAAKRLTSVPVGKYCQLRVCSRLS